MQSQHSTPATTIGDDVHDLSKQAGTGRGIGSPCPPGFIIWGCLALPEIIVYSWSRCRELVTGPRREISQTWSGAVAPGQGIPEVCRGRFDHNGFLKAIKAWEREVTCPGVADTFGWTTLDPPPCLFIT